MTRALSWPMAAVMRAPAALLAVALLAAPSARAQSFVSEEVQGNRRLCNYGGANGLLTGRTRGLQHQVGLGENCPVTYPLVNAGRLAPPTAPLSSDTLSAEGRICVYEKWGSRWTFNLRGQPACPPVAGMIPGLRPATDPGALPQ